MNYFPRPLILRGAVGLIWAMMLLILTIESKMEFKKMLILLFVINNFNNNINIVYFSSKAAIYTLAHFYPSIPILYYIPIHVGRYFSVLMVT